MDTNRWRYSSHERTGMITHQATLYQYTPPLLRMPFWLRKVTDTTRITLQHRRAAPHSSYQKSKLFNTSLRYSRAGVSQPRRIRPTSLSPPLSPQDEQLNQLVKKSRTILYRISSVFPFDFFPDTLIIDETKVEIRQRIFFMFEKVSPILISDIKTVTVSCGPIFASLVIELVGQQQDNPDPINYLWRWEARRACRIILGLITCFQEGIDLGQLANDNVIERLVIIGRAT